MSESPDSPPPAPSDVRAVPSALLPARERLIARLTDGFARDALSVEEFERRLSLAYEAESVEALDALSVDLPAEAPAAPALPAAAPLRIASVLSNVVRSGPQELPRRLEMRSWLGNLELNLTVARFPPGVTEIALDVFLGNIEIRLPHDVRVDDDTNAMLASFECRQRDREIGAGELPDPRPVVRFTGRIVLGNVTVSA
jgi:hypothetical protein